MQGAILPLFYLPPIEYFNNFVKYKENILIEQYEHFPKQTFRNRASIQSPNGKLDLIIPVVKGSKVHTKVKDVRISYDFDWQRLHWMSLQTSYRRSSYFEYYEDQLSPFYEKKWDYLLDFNLEIFTLLLKLLKLKGEYALTQSYEEGYEGMADLRNSISPKKTSAHNFQPYYQVFEERHGFIPNLSIVDLLFSQGPQSSKFILYG
jgi:hypothetical protein